MKPRIPFKSRRPSNPQYRGDNYNPLLNLVAKGANVTGNIRVDIPGNKTIVISIDTRDTDHHNEMVALVERLKKG